MLFPKRPTAMKADPKLNTAPPPPMMPNVFVTPPEEDDAPAWCCFDAANPSLSQVIERERRQPQDIFDEENRFYYSAVDPHTERGAAGPTDMKTSIVDAAIGKRGFVAVGDDDDGGDDDDIDLETISDYGHELEDVDKEREPMSRDVANDSDVVEVVKVRRRTSEYQEGGDRPVE